MNETIGEFAKTEINMILEELQNIRNKKEKLSDTTYQKYKDFFDLIGDKLLKKILISNLEDFR